MTVSRAVFAVVFLLMGSSCSFFGGGGDDQDPVPQYLRLGLVAPASLDPTRARTMEEALLVDQLFDGLTSVDLETGEAEPAVASGWSVSEDGLVWTFTLSDAEFSNGDQITPEDVAATLSRAADRPGGSVAADLLEPVVGWREVAIDGTADELSGVAVVGDNQIAVSLTSPWSTFAIALAQPTLGIVPSGSAAGVEVDDLAGLDEEDLPAGSGPFALARVELDRLTLRPAGTRSVRSSGISVVTFPDHTSAYAAFANGDVDWSAVPVEEIDDAASRFGSDNFRTYVAELFYAFNLRDPKWADRRLREAVVRAVDPAPILDDVYDGRMVPMTAFTVQGVPGAPLDSCGDVCRVDVERARGLLAEITAGGGVLPEINVDFEEDEVQAAVAAHIEASLEAVGLVVNLRPKPIAEYESFAASGDQDLFRLGWIAAYPSPDAFVTPLFASSSANNLIGFASPAVDALLQQARAQREVDARHDLYSQAESAVFAEVPVLPIGHFRQHWVAAERVRGLELTVMGTFDAGAVWLED